jgi:small subunit ribosomal protein S9
MVEIVKYGATGRRKTSVARVNLTPGSGKFLINNRSFEEYFSREADRNLILIPFQLTNSLNKFDLNAKVLGGGLSGQAGALQLGISRALSLCDNAYRETLRKAKYLTRDPRMKERKKPGLKGARKRFQWVKR